MDRFFNIFHLIVSINCDTPSGTNLPTQRKVSTNCNISVRNKTMQMRETGFKNTGPDLRQFNDVKVDGVSAAHQLSPGTTQALQNTAPAKIRFPAEFRSGPVRKAPSQHPIIGAARRARGMRCQA
jgi:hypothetical protein